MTSPYLTHKDQRVLLVPMDPQPSIVSQMIRDMVDGEFDDPPIRVGDMVPVREEWMLDVNGRGKPWIEYRDGEKRDCPDDVLEGIPDSLAVHVFDVGILIWGDWQPAETMPDFAVRYWRRATKIGAVRCFDVDEALLKSIGFEKKHSDVLASNGHIWRIDVEPEEGE